ncbi:MAG: hypothetical protein NVSMB8_13900 [Candidatus Limnocylindrales bacterium]
MTRERIVAGNWKMNPPTIEQAVTLARAIGRLPGATGVRVIVAAPAIALPAVADALRGTAVGVFAQDVHWEQKGAFTGQLAASMLAGIASGTIVGHSEVRRDQGDDDARVAGKLLTAVRAGLEVIACVGESEAEYASVSPAAYSASLSPTQAITSRPARTAVRSLPATRASASP